MELIVSLPAVIGESRGTAWQNNRSLQNNVPEHRREINALKAFPISTTNETMPRRKFKHWSHHQKALIHCSTLQRHRGKGNGRNKQLAQLGIKKWGEK